MARATSRKIADNRSRTRRAAGGAPDEVWKRRALEAIRSTVAPTRDLDAALAPIDAFRERHRAAVEVDSAFERYAREFASAHLEASHALGKTLEDRRFTFADHYLKPWLDIEPHLFFEPSLLVFVPDRPGSTAAPDRRYALEWTTQLPPLVNEFDPIARAVRWRDQNASASKTEGTCFARFATNGDQSDVQAGVGILFQPKRRRPFQFRPLALWRSWVSISADAPPQSPHPIATVRTHGWVRLVAQSWRAADGSDFRTDAVINIDLFDYLAATPNRVWAQEDAGVATPDGAGWVELPGQRDRMFALWAIVRGWSGSTYAPPSLSSAITYASTLVPLMFVEYR